VRYTGVVLKPVFSVAAAVLLGMQSRDELRQALKDEVAGKEWHYDNFADAVAASKQSGKPILAVVR
jgi:hypothetical protein